MIEKRGKNKRKNRLRSEIKAVIDKIKLYKTKRKKKIRQEIIESC